MLRVQELPLPPEPEGQYRDAREPTSGQVLVHSHAPADKHEEEHEVDEGFFSTEVPEGDKDKPLKRGKGSQKKTKVLVMAQTGAGMPTKKSDKPTSVKYIKMIVINDLKSETVDGKVRLNVDPSSVIISDDSKSYTNFCKLVKEHIQTQRGRKGVALGSHRHLKCQEAPPEHIP